MLTTIKILKEIYEELNQKSTVSVMMSASVSRQYPKDVIEEISDVKQILSGKVEMTLKVGLQVTGQEMLGNCQLGWREESSEGLVWSNCTATIA